MSEVAMCSETTWDGWHSHPCRWPVKRDGMCGIHAAGKERSERNHKAREEKRRAEQERRTAATKRQQELLDAEQAVIRVRRLADEWERHGIGITLDRLNELRAVLDAATPADSTRAVGHE